MIRVDRVPAADIPPISTGYARQTKEGDVIFRMRRDLTAAQLAAEINRIGALIRPPEMPGAKG